MKVVHDRKTDTLPLILSEEELQKAMNRDGVIKEYSEKGQVISVEILDVSKSAMDPTAI